MQCVSSHVMSCPVVLRRVWLVEAAVRMSQPYRHNSSDLYEVDPTFLHTPPFADSA